MIAVARETASRSSQVRKLSRCRLRRSRLRGFIVVSPPSSSSPRRNSHESSAATEGRRDTEDASRHFHSTISIESTPVLDALWVGALDPNPVPLIRDQADGGGVPPARRGVPDQAGCDGSAWQFSRLQLRGCRVLSRGQRVGLIMDSCQFHCRRYDCCQRAWPGFPGAGAGDASPWGAQPGGCHDPAPGRNPG